MGTHTATRTVIVGGRPQRRMKGYVLRRVDGTVERFELPHLRAGSRQDNDLHLDDPAVSRLHFELVAEELGFRLRDLGSRNGTWVDGHRVLDVYLNDGSAIRAGAVELRFELEEREIDIPATASDGFGPLVGSSLPMREMYALLERAAAADVTILVQGETGTGKELIARAVHERSKRSTGPYVVVDCGAVTPTLLESELFGHEKGAFTGANARRVGLLEEANGGTVFIDELGELPIELQPKLLRALETREIRRLGGTETIPLDIRIVAATHRDLATEVNRGSFREDLYYRLAVVPIHVPALRERREDVRALAQHFIRQVLRDDPERATRTIDGIDEANWKRLEGHPWPGNVRELRNVIERTLALSDSAAVSVELGRAGASAPNAQVEIDLTRPFVEQKAAILAAFEERYLSEQLDKHDGNFSRAAAASGIDRMYFKRLLKKYKD